MVWKVWIRLDLDLFCTVDSWVSWNPCTTSVFYIIFIYNIYLSLQTEASLSINAAQQYYFFTTNLIGLQTELVI